MADDSTEKVDTSESTSGSVVGSESITGSGSTSEESSTSESESSAITSGIDTPNASEAQTDTGTTVSPVEEPHIVTDDDYYNNKAFQNLGLRRPIQRWDLEHWFGDRPANPDYIWASYQLHPGEDLVSLWRRFGPNVRQIMDWSSIYDYHWQNKIMTLRIKREILPHD